MAQMCQYDGRIVIKLRAKNRTDDQLGMVYFIVEILMVF